MFQELIPVPTEDRNLQVVQSEFVERLAVSYADQQLLQWMNKIPSRYRVVLFLAIATVPPAVRKIRSLLSKDEQNA